MIAALEQPTDATLLQQRANAFAIDTIVEQYLDVLENLSRQDALQAS
jgi:hypothetical protein